MIAVAFAAMVAAAAPEVQTPPHEPVRPAAASPPADPSLRKLGRRRRSSSPDVSRIVDPYRSEAFAAPARVDPQHPSLAPLPDEAEGGGGDLGRVSPVPPDPWAPTVAPLEPPGGSLRPPDSEG